MSGADGDNGRAGQPQEFMEHAAKAELSEAVGGWWETKDSSGAQGRAGMPQELSGVDGGF